MTHETAPDQPSPSPVGTWGPWLAGIGVGIWFLCAMAVALEWDDLALALDLVRDLR